MRTMPSATHGPSPCSPGVGSVVTADRNTTASETNPTMRSATGGPVPAIGGSSRRFTSFTP